MTQVGTFDLARLGAARSAEGGLANAATVATTARVGPGTASAPAQRHGLSSRAGHSFDYRAGGVARPLALGPSTGFTAPVLAVELVGEAPKPLVQRFGCEQTWYSRIGKPLLDRTIAALAILPALLVTIMLVLWLRPQLDPGRGIFRQQRVGRDGRVFTIWKLRTMRTRPPEGVGADVESSDEARHVPRGLLARKWSLDELPQLWNVLRGEMSLVGPRPELAQLVDANNLWEHPRHLVRPGLTGMWQISELRAAPLVENVDYDLGYVERVTFRGDVAILVATVKAVLRRRTK